MVDGVLRLSGGRRIGCCTWGDRGDPAVVYFHGMPGSRLEVYWTRPALERLRLPVHVIGLDRPGYGRSSSGSPPGYSGWSADVVEALARLGVDRFAVLGFSGGSPWALACARERPDEVSRVGVIGGVAPPGTPGMERAAAMSVDPRSPLRQALAFGAMWAGSRVGLADRISRSGLSGLSPADRSVLSMPDAAALSSQITRDGYARFGRAFAHERTLVQQSWDFDPSEVCQPTHFWHGEADTRVAPSVSARFAERLPDAACTVWSGHGHLSWPPSDEFGQVIRFLTDP
jgi:pimeloyl-ACP methyl ester carboxylesterase